MKKKLLCLFMVLTLTMSMFTALTFANSTGDEENIAPTSTFAMGFSTKRISDTKASASVSVDFTDIANSYTVYVILQKKTSSGWVTATDITSHTIKYIGKNSSGVLTYDEWTVKKGGLYRVKCTATDSYPGIEYTQTNYSDPF